MPLHHRPNISVQTTRPMLGIFRSLRSICRREQRRSFPRWKSGRRIFCFIFFSLLPLVQGPRDVGGSPERPCLARGDCCPPGKGCNRAGPSSRDEAGVLQPLLHRTQERWWLSANPGSASLEPGFAQAPVQDADAQAHDQMHSAPGLVCSDRPEGRLLSRKKSSPPPYS